MSNRIDRYEIVRKLATGGMADVFLALQWGDGGFVREVVVKRLHAHHDKRTDLLEDFRNEADLLARLRFEGVPQVLEFRHSEAGEWYLTMEHVRGPTLKELTEYAGKGQRLPTHVSLAIGISLCELLDHIHDYTDPLSGSELGVVHGDVTSTNVIVDALGRVHLIDFGLAGGDHHRSLRIGPDHGIRGTVGYLAPEVAEGRVLPDRRADVFALGVLLYELLGGQMPFPKDSVAYVTAIAKGQCQTLSALNASVPPAVAEAVMTCLSASPEMRPSRAGDLAERLAGAARAAGLFVERGAIGEYVETYYPEQDAPTRVGDPHRAFVVPLPSATTTGGDHLSVDEREDLLADLAFFAPDSDAFVDLPPVRAPAQSPMPRSPVPQSPMPQSPMPRSPMPQSPVPQSMRSPTPRPRSPMPQSMAQPPPLPSPPARPERGQKRTPRAGRGEKSTPVAFPSPMDLATTRTPIPYDVVIDDSLEEGKTDPPDSGGFYIYVADED